MLEIKIYGKPSSSYEYMKGFIKKTADKAKISIEIEEINETEEFIKNNIMSIPAYQFNGKIHELGQQNMEGFIREMQLDLLRHAQYGKMKKIIVPVDFTETSDVAVNYAMHLGAHLDSVVKLVHVVHPQVTVLEGQIIVNDTEEKKRAELTALAKELNQSWVDTSHAPLVDSEVVPGFTFEAINHLSKENSNGWIVIGSTGKRNILTQIFGSVSESVVKKSDCPVFFIPPNAEFTAIDKILLCSSDPKIDIQAVKDLSAIAKIFKSEIHIVHYNENKKYEGDELILKIKEEFPSNNIIYNEISGNKPVEAIHTYAKAYDIKMIALARHKKSSVEEFFYKSFTKQLSNKTRIPLLVIHK